MLNQNALTKRIKRHVVGRVRDYFAVTAPGLESVCLKELDRLPLSVKDARVVAGGVAFKGKLADCHLANLNLRTAGRVLLRICSFKATGFRELKTHLADIPWELHLSPHASAGIRATATHCRVHQTTDIAEHVTRSMTAALGKPKSSVPGQSTQTIFIRGEDDRFTVSIDSSGSLLYRRGIKVHKGRAPIRETLAAAVLQMADWVPRMVLADPMCGTGSFSLEAALRAKRIPAGWFRSFAFQEWPSFTEQRWAYLKKEHARKIVKLPRPLIFASDIDAGACSALAACVQDHDLSDAMRVSKRDFFTINPRTAYPAAGLVVINPPYGRRLAAPGNIEKLYGHIGEKLGHDFKDWRAAVIASENRFAKLLPVMGKSYRLLHGGLALRLVAGRIQQNKAL